MNISRRNFLRRAATVIGALTLCPTVLISNHKRISATYPQAMVLHVVINETEDGGYSFEHNWKAISNKA